MQVAFWRYKWMVRHLDVPDKTNRYEALCNWLDKKEKTYLQLMRTQFFRNLNGSASLDGQTKTFKVVDNFSALLDMYLGKN